MEFQIGDICDFGEEKNASLVSLQRAVWVGEDLPAGRQDTKESKKTAEAVVAHLPGGVAPAAHLEGEETKEETAAEPEEEAVAQGEETKEPEQEKHLLENDLQKKVQQKKKGSSKKSFWDNLK